jgi:hypothetical protein
VLDGRGAAETAKANLDFELGIVVHTHKRYSFLSGVITLIQVTNRLNEEQRGEAGHAGA